MVSRTGVHALRALNELARLDDGTYLGAQDVARRVGAPPNYLGKLLRTLADHGLVESQKGKGGGFRLSRDPRRISLYDVLEPIDRISRWSGCFLGKESCSHQDPCALHVEWSRVRDVYVRFLETTSIADLDWTPDRRPEPPVPVPAEVPAMPSAGGGDESNLIA